MNRDERGPSSGNIGWNRYVNTSAEAVAELEFWRYGSSTGIPSYNSNSGRSPLFVLEIRG